MWCESVTSFVSCVAYSGTVGGHSLENALREWTTWYTHTLSPLRTHLGRYYSTPEKPGAGLMKREISTPDKGGACTKN